MLNETSRKADGRIGRMTSPKAKKPRIKFPYPDEFDYIIKRVLPDANQTITNTLKQKLEQDGFWEDQGKLKSYKALCTKLVCKSPCAKPAYRARVQSPCAKARVFKTQKLVCAKARAQKLVSAKARV